MPWSVATGATDRHPWRDFVLILECPQVASVLAQDALRGGSKRIRKSHRHGGAGEIGRCPELNLGGRHVDPQVRTHAVLHPVDDQPADMVHVHVGEHHVRNGCKIDAGGL